MPIDPITISIIQHRLYYVNAEMSEAMLRTAYSQILNSSRDFSIGIFDGEGRLISQADNLPVHVGGLPFAMAEIRKRFAARIDRGDVFLVNDPYYGGSHLPDITCFVPIFAGLESEPIFWAVNRSHSSDIGGSAAGSYNPDATEIWQEGIRITPLKLYRAGCRDDDLLHMLATNVRHFDDFIGDLNAMIGSTHVGAKRLAELIDEYGADQLRDAIEHILDASEHQTRADISTWKDGVYSGQSILDDDGHGAVNIVISARVTVSGSDIHVDLSATDPQVSGIVNSSYANTMSAVHMAIAYLTPSGITKNSGSFRPVKVTTKQGTLVHPFEPAPVTLSTNHPAQEIAEAIFRALEGACPDRVVGGWGRRFRIALQGKDPRTNRSFIWHLFHGRPGGGGSAAADGWHGAGELSSGGGLKFSSIEVAEARFPLFFAEHEFAPETAGAGKHRGGFGSSVRIRLETDRPVSGVTAGDGAVHAPHGIAGGQSGTPHRYHHIKAADGMSSALPTKATRLKFAPGDWLHIVSSGGGGYGPPTARGKADRLKDVEEGFAVG